jgi:hypothetical protein
MIPSEFNQDAAAQRRKLQQLNEAKKFKVGQKVQMIGSLAQQMKREGLAIQGEVLTVRKLQGNTHLKVRWSDGGDRGVLGSNVKVVKEEYITEKVSIVAADNKTGEVILNVLPGVSRLDVAHHAEIERIVKRIQKVLKTKATRGHTIALEKMPGRPSSDRRFWSVKLGDVKDPGEVAKWLRKNLEGLF